MRMRRSTVSGKTADPQWPDKMDPRARLLNPGRNSRSGRDKSPTGSKGNGPRRFGVPTQKRPRPDHYSLAMRMQEIADCQEIQRCYDRGGFLREQKPIGGTGNIWTLKGGGESTAGIGKACRLLRERVPYANFCRFQSLMGSLCSRNRP